LDIAVRSVLMRQGVLGIRVTIMLPHDPSGRIGPKKPLADSVTITEPKDEAPRHTVPMGYQVNAE
jgi:small subunit ribosomal protein S3e